MFIMQEPAFRVPHLGEQLSVRMRRAEIVRSRRHDFTPVLHHWLLGRSIIRLEIPVIVHQFAVKSWLFLISKRVKMENQWCGTCRLQYKCLIIVGFSKSWRCYPVRVAGRSGDGTMAAVLLTGEYLFRSTHTTATMYAARLALPAARTVAVSTNISCSSLVSRNGK